MTRAELDVIRTALILAGNKWDQTAPNRPDFEGAMMAVQKEIDRRDWFWRELDKATMTLEM